MLALVLASAWLFGAAPSLEEFRSAYRELDAAARAGRELGDALAKVRALQPTLSEAEKKQADVALALAHAAFLALEPSYRDFVSPSLPDETGAVRRIAALLKEAQRLQKEYGQIGEATGWGVAARIRTGQVFEKLCSQLEELPTPKGLTPEQADLFRGELQARARAVETKAIESYQEALKLAASLKLMGPWPDLARERLSALQQPPPEAPQP